MYKIALDTFQAQIKIVNGCSHLNPLYRPQKTPSVRVEHPRVSQLDMLDIQAVCACLRVFI